MTQAELAGFAGVSQSYISRVEAGRKGVERRSTLVAIAKALQVTVANLLGQPGDPTDPLKAGAADAGPDIWAALIEIDQGERRTPTRTGERLDDAVNKLANLRARSDYPTIAGLLPDLLIDAAAHDVSDWLQRSQDLRTKRGPSRTSMEPFGPGAKPPLRWWCRAGLDRPAGPAHQVC